ncbi:MAG TPA: hypothetical protein VNF73_14640 [Candidatus Saccharimonadales bacterium]|nr:hypothetical protein [Candidatus Saccharimonadales bacterium]
MTRSSFAASGMSGAPTVGTEYQPGTCNIGPAEIGLRRRAGQGAGDRARAERIALAGLAVGVAFAILAAVVPL